MNRETDAFFEALGYRHGRGMGGYFSDCVNKQRVALVAHQGLGLVFLASLLDIPYPQFCTHFDLGPYGYDDDSLSRTGRICHSKDITAFKRFSSVPHRSFNCLSE